MCAIWNKSTRKFRAVIKTQGMSFSTWRQKRMSWQPRRDRGGRGIVWRGSRSDNYGKSPAEAADVFKKIRNRC